MPLPAAQSQDINECYWNRPKQRNFNMHPPSNAHQFSNVLPMSSMHLVPIHLEFSLMMGMLMELTTLITNIMRMWSVCWLLFYIIIQLLTLIMSSQ